MADHYNNITVSSNVDMFREFPENTQSNFKVPLMRPLHLTGEWEACVKEVLIPNFIHNVGENIGKIHILYRHKVLKVVVMNMFQRAVRMKKWYNTE